jgi:hypothetical protein
MSMKSISIVSEKKRFDKSRILNSKFVVISKALFSTSRREKFEISTCFSICDFEFALNELSVKNSTTNRRSYEKLAWTRFFFFLRWFVSFHSTFADNFVKFSRCEAKFIWYGSSNDDTFGYQMSHIYQTRWHYRIDTWNYDMCDDDDLSEEC